jgi:DNA-binding Lrp family transcriptional regulator
LDDLDLALLRSLVSTGIPLRPDEVASDDSLRVTAEQVRERMDRLIDAGYVKITYAVTTKGGSFAYRHIHHHRDLRSV